MSGSDWEKRARELFPEPNVATSMDEDCCNRTARPKALQLGREMAAAAHSAEAAVCAKIMGEKEHQWRERVRLLEEAHVKELAEQKRQAADARSEEIAVRIDAMLGKIDRPTNATTAAYHNSAAIARSTIRSAQSAGDRPDGPPAAEGDRIAKPEVVFTAKDPSKQHIADAMARACQPLIAPMQAALAEQSEAAIRADEREKIAAHLEMLLSDAQSIRGTVSVSLIAGLRQASAYVRSLAENTKECPTCGKPRG